MGTLKAAVCGPARRVAGLLTGVALALACRGCGPSLTPDGGRCLQDDTCEGGACNHEQCATKCAGDGDCPGGFQCEGSAPLPFVGGGPSICVQRCAAPGDAPCPLGQFCDGGLCDVGESAPFVTLTQSDFSARTGEAIRFTAQVSEGSGVVESVSWSFGDGSSAEGAQVSHAWTTAGSYRVVLSVDDANGLSRSQHGAVTVCGASGDACDAAGDLCCTACQLVGGSYACR